MMWAVENVKETKKQNMSRRLEYCPQPWRFLCLPALKEELTTRGLPTVGVRKLWEERIAQYEDRLKRMGSDDSVDMEVPPTLFKGPLTYEFFLASCLKHVIIRPWKDEMFDVPGVGAWINEASSYVLRKLKSDTKLNAAILKFDTIEKGDAACFDLKEKLQDRSVIVEHPPFQPMNFSTQKKMVMNDPFEEFVTGADKAKDNFLARLILLENVPSDLCVDEKLCGIFPEALSAVSYDHNTDSKGLAVLEMTSEDAVKQLLSEEFTVQIEIEGNKIYASKYNTRVKTWTIALRVNRKIRDQENQSNKPSNNASEIKNEAEEADDKDMEDGGVIDIDTQDIVLSDSERLEKSRELHKLNIKMANLSNHIDIFGFEKIEEHKKYSQKSRLLYKDLVVDGKRRLKLGETLPEPIGQISEQMQNTMGYNNAPLKQLKSIEEKYAKAKKVMDDAKVNLGNLWTHVMQLEKSLSGSALKEFKKTKNKMGIDFFRDKGQKGQLAAKEINKDGESGPVVKQEVKDKKQQKGNSATQGRRPTDDRYNDRKSSGSRDHGKYDQKRRSDGNSGKSSSGRNENWKNDRRTRERDSRSRSPVTRGRKRSYDSTEKINVIDYDHKLGEKSGGSQMGRSKGREQQRRDSASAASSKDETSGGNDWGKFLEQVFGQEKQGNAAANQGKSQSAGRSGERIGSAAMDIDEAGRRMATSFTDRKLLPPALSSAAAPLFPIDQQPVGTSSNQSGPMDKSKGPIPDDPSKWLSDYYRATQQILTDRSERKPSDAANSLPGNPQQPTQQQVYQQMLLDKKFLQERLLQQKAQSAPSQQQLPKETEQARQPSSQDVQKSKDMQKSQHQKDEPKLQLVSYDMEDDGSEEEQHNRRKSRERSRSSERNRKKRSTRDRSRSRSRHGRRSRSRGRNRSQSRDRSEERKKARIVARHIENRHKKTSTWQAQPKKQLPGQAQAKKQSPWQPQQKRQSPWQAQMRQYERERDRKQRLEEMDKKNDIEREQRKQEKRERQECIEKLLREKRERERKAEEEAEERRKKIQEKLQKIDKTALGLGRKRDRIKVVGESPDESKGVEDDQNQPKVDYIVAQKVTAKPKVQAAPIAPTTVASTKQKTSELAAKLGISEDMAIKALQVHGNLGADIGLSTQNRAANPLPTQGQFAASQTPLADKMAALPAASPSIPSQSYRHPIMSGNHQILGQLPASHSQTVVRQSPQFPVSMVSQSSNQRMVAGKPLTTGSAPLGLAHSDSQGMALANPQIGHVTAATHTNNPTPMERPSQIPGGMYGAPLRAAPAEVTPLPEAPQMPAMAAAPSAAALSKLNAIEAVLNEKMRRLKELQTKNSYPAAVNPEAGHSTTSGLQDIMSAAVSQATSTHGQAMMPLTAGQTSNIQGVMPSAAGQSSHMPSIMSSAAAGQTADNESLMRAYKDRLLGLRYTGMPQNPDSYL